MVTVLDLLTLQSLPLSSSDMLRAFVSDRAVRWVSLGWAAFVAENLALSQYREQLIAATSNDIYHAVYNTLSGGACLSVAYGFLRYRNETRIWASRVPRPLVLASFVLQGTGLVLASQLLPKLQVPVELVQAKVDVEPTAPTPSDDSKHNSKTTSSDATESTSGGSSILTMRFKARCPMDFGSRTSDADGAVSGIQRITRHPMLWSLALFAAGAALRTPFASTVALCSGPIAMGVIGTTHIDYRYRRGSGGELSAAIDEITSNIPFEALVRGRQQWEAVWAELKTTNAWLALATAALLAVRHL